MDGQSGSSGMGSGSGGMPSVRGRARARNRVNLTPSSVEESSVVSERQSTCPSEDVQSTAATVGSDRDLGSTLSVASGGSTVTLVKAGGSKGSSGSDPSKGLRVTLRKGFSKFGKGGESFHVLTNYLNINKTPNFQLHQYRVDFNPEEDSTQLKKMLVRSHEATLGSFIFDGHMLYTTKPIPPEHRELSVTSQSGEVTFKILIRPVGYVLPTSPMYLQFYNMVMRKCMTLIDMEELGRHFYDRHSSIKFEEDRLELWPGIITAIRNHELGTFLCIEVTHKVLRMTTVKEMIDIIKGKTRSHQEYMSEVKKQLVGVIVITHYNRRTYKVDDVAFDVTPNSTFRHQDGVCTKYSEYYLKKYNVTVLDLEQPMLVSNPKKRDINKGITGDIYLVPALCNPTGLTDDMRKNFTLMKKLSEHLHMGPSQRKRKLDEFVRKIRSTDSVQAEFAKWDIDFIPDYVMATARKYPTEKIYMGPEDSEPTQGDQKADWTRTLKGRGMLYPKVFSDWILFVPQRDEGFAKGLVEQMKYAANQIQVCMTDPVALIGYDPRRTASELREGLKRQRNPIKFAFIVLSSNNVNIYAEVKKLCILEYSIGCQCFLAKNMNRNDPKTKQKLGSICTKVMIQITAKLGGVPWGVKIPVRKLMILGFDVYHCSERKGESAGALVSTTDEALHQYFSTVNFHKDKSELAKNLIGGMRKALEAFRMHNKGALPDRVVLYRDGVGEGQINYVLDDEIPQLQAAIQEVYKNNEQELARLSVVIVTKKINTRALLEKGTDRPVYENVPPGTVIDNVVTLPERYDFFLVSQSVNQGTVSPTNYNVVFDESGFTAEQMQKLSFKLCHLYYNWCGTVAVPAPCQYAHKLAYLTGISLNSQAPLALSNTLWYL